MKVPQFRILSMILCTERQSKYTIVLSTRSDSENAVIVKWPNFVGIVVISQKGRISDPSQVYLLQIGERKRFQHDVREDGHENDARSIPYLEPASSVEFRNRGAHRLQFAV